MSSWDKEWAMCFSGRRVYPFDLRPEDIDINDIAHALAMQCRYNGHVSRFYSVGEHCIRVSDALMRDHGDPLLALRGLLHDAGEAYTGDFTRPVKNSLRQVGEVLHDAEDRNEQTILRRFGIDPGFGIIEVKDYDRRIIVDEKEALFGENKPWDWDLEPLRVPIIGWEGNVVVLLDNYDNPVIDLCNWSPGRVKAEYLSRFYTLTKKVTFS